MAELPRAVRGHTCTVMITIFFGGKLGILGGSFYRSNTLDRTLLAKYLNVLLFSNRDTFYLISDKFRTK